MSFNMSDSSVSHSMISPRTNAHRNLFPALAITGIILLLLLLSVLVFFSVSRLQHSRKGNSSEPLSNTRYSNGISTTELERGVADSRLPPKDVPKSKYKTSYRPALHTFNPFVLLPPTVPFIFPPTQMSVTMSEKRTIPTFSCDLPRYQTHNTQHHHSVHSYVEPITERTSQLAFPEPAYFPDISTNVGSATRTFECPTILSPYRFDSSSDDTECPPVDTYHTSTPHTSSSEMIEETEQRVDVRLFSQYLPLAHCP